MPRKGYKECPACAEWIREKAKFCRFCGTPLTDEPFPKFPPGKKGRLDKELSQSVESRFAEAGVEITWQHRQRLEQFLRRSEDEYRVASVMFVDIVGYTAICEKLKPEYVKDVLNIFRTICTQVVDFFNGFIVEYEGDMCLAVFGAPVAYDRDVESAVRAALGIRERIRVFPPIHGVKIRISVGIETGEILSSVIRARARLHYDVFGYAVNLASRIQSVGSADNILIGPSTYDMVKGVFEFRRRPARRFKNVRKPIPTYEIVTAKGAKAVRQALAVPFIGRKRELDRMAELWTRFLDGLTGAKVRTPVCCGIILTGEPGIGKTRLTLEFAQRCQRQARILYVEGAPYGEKLPWGVWRSVIASLWKGSSEEPQEAVLANLTRLLSDLGYGLEEHNTFKALFGFPEAVEALSSLEPSVLRRLLCADLRDLLERLSHQQPLLLILDDLQWADRTSLDVLEALVTHPPPRGVFYLLVHRTGFLLKPPGFKDLAHIRLHDLDEPSRNALFNLLADIREIMPEVREILLQQAEGNPFYMMELVHTLKAKLEEIGRRLPDKALVNKLREWVPLSLEDMLQSRIDLLDRRRKLVLQCAAVLGRRFALQIIELFKFIREGLLARLYSLKTLEFIDDIATPEGLEFLFRHHVTREVAYQSLIERTRRKFHRVVAEEIEKKFATRLSDFCQLLAYHFSQSDAHERAAHYLQMAGDRACAVAAADEAIEYYEEALERLRQCEQSKRNLRRTVTILRSKGRMHRWVGDQKSAMDSLCTALALIGDLNGKKEIAHVQVEIGLTLVQTSNYEEAKNAFTTALKTIRRRKDPQLLGTTLNGLGLCAWGEGNFEQARSYFEEICGLELEKLNPKLAADVCNNLALIEWKGGRLVEASKTFKTALHLRHKTGDKFGIALTLMNLGIIEENMGRYAVAEKHYRDALSLAERIHFAQVLTAVHANLANLCLVRERNLEALEHSAKSLEIAEQIKDRRSAAIALENLVLSHLALKQFEDSYNSIRKAYKLARQIGDNERLLSLELAEIELLLAEDKITPVGAMLKKAEENLEKGGFEAERPRLLRLSVWAHLKAGRLPEAREVATQAIKEAHLQNNRTEEDRVAKLQTILKGSAR